MILLFWLKRENDFTILVGREYDFTVFEIDTHYDTCDGAVCCYS